MTKLPGWLQPMHKVLSKVEWRIRIMYTGKVSRMYHSEFRSCLWYAGIELTSLSLLATLSMHIPWFGLLINTCFKSQEPLNGICISAIQPLSVLMVFAENGIQSSVSCKSVIKYLHVIQLPVWRNGKKQLWHPACFRVKAYSKTFCSFFDIKIPKKVCYSYAAMYERILVFHTQIQIVLSKKNSNSCPKLRRTFFGSEVIKYLQGTALANLSIKMTISNLDFVCITGGRNNKRISNKNPILS